MSNGFLEQVVRIVGSGNLLTSESELAGYATNSLDISRRLRGVVRPGSESEVVEVIKLFAQHKLPFYTISTGRNWGYGGATPVAEDCFVLELSRLRRITDFNESLGYVTVEPGVTQQDLYDFLGGKNNSRFLVPTTGAGPTASVLGNALERGYGITPYEDHFGSLLGISAVLADGSIYQSALKELGGSYSDQVFKWKIGPHLEGLFAQSNLGVVTQGTIALAQKPENVTQFIAFIAQEDFEEAVQVIRQIKAHLGSVVGGVNLMNRRRLLSMMESQWSHEGPLDEMRVIRLAKNRGVPDWAMVGALYGPRALVSPAKRLVRKMCRPVSQRTVFVDRRRHRIASRLARVIPSQRLRIAVENVGMALEILEGTPSQVAMPLAYLKNSREISGQERNPDRDNCGLIWFAPLVPIDPPVVRDFVGEVTKICLYHKFDPFITLTAISERCFDATVPILYDKDLLGESLRARTCFDDLLSACREMGLFPYRLDIDHMGLFARPEVPSFSIARKIKLALDPDQIISPGRYISSIERPGR